MADLTQEQVRAEADARVLSALDHIETAQREFERACQDLCAVIGGLSQYQRTSRLHLNIDAHWHRLAEWARGHRGKLSLDEFGRGALAKKLDGSAP